MNKETFKILDIMSNTELVFWAGANSYFKTVLDKALTQGYVLSIHDSTYPKKYPVKKYVLTECGMKAVHDYAKGWGKVNG